MEIQGFSFFLIPRHHFKSIIRANRNTIAAAGAFYLINLRFSGQHFNAVTHVRRQAIGSTGDGIFRASCYTTITAFAIVKFQLCYKTGALKNNFIITHIITFFDFGFRLISDFGFVISDFGFRSPYSYVILHIIVTHNMQQAARTSDITAFFYMGDLIEMNRTEMIFSNPAKKQTEDYISGRFG